MKVHYILFLILMFTTTLGFTQETGFVEDQNPNYEESMSKYLQMDNSYVLGQGTTLQETYVAIDPLEERRKLRALRKQYRANRRLWRHQERMELAKNGVFYRVDNGFNTCRNRYNNWFDANDVLTIGSLGLLGYYLFR